MTAAATQSRPRIAVVVFPGSNDDRDAALALETLGAEAELVWHGEPELPSVDAAVLPGGFSYGDYLRCGAIARFSPVLASVAELAAAGRPVLGICNGFQVLCEAGLLPGVLRVNESLRFVCRDVRLRVERAAAPFTSRCSDGDRLVIPVKHGEGRWLCPDELLADLEGNDQIVLRYETGDNPNGALGDVAAVCNARRQRHGPDAPSRARGRSAARIAGRRPHSRFPGRRRTRRPAGRGRIATRCRSDTLTGATR